MVQEERPEDIPGRPVSAWEHGDARVERGVPGAPGWVYAGVGGRIAAWLLDGFFFTIFAVVLLIPFAAILPTGSDAYTFASAVVIIVGSWAYFVLSWRSRGRATPGQRIMRLQVGNAASGRTLTVEQGTSRWFALGSPFLAFALIPAVAGLASIALLVWELVLLVTTAQSPTRQGLHDRFARSAVVEPKGASRSAAIGCLILLLFGLPIAIIVSLIFLGSQLEEVLRAIGESV